MALSRSCVESDPAVSGAPLFQAVLHELVTPMSVIDALARDLLEPSAPLDAAQQRRRLERILRATDELRSIVRAAQAALVSQREAADASASGVALADAGFAPVATVVASVVEAACALSGRHPVGAELEPAAGVALCDAHPLGLVLRTLVGNALKYAPPGTPVSVSARCVPLGVEVVVADAGPGVSPQALPQLFEPHYRGANAAGLPGEGMGLALARKLITGMGGSLTAHLRPCGGLAVRAFVPWGSSLRRPVAAVPEPAHPAA